MAKQELTQHPGTQAHESQRQVFTQGWSPAPWEGGAMSGLPEGPTVLFGVLRSQVLWNLLAAEVEGTAWMDQEGLQPLSPPEC